jgi:hypothetical protein
MSRYSVVFKASELDVDVLREICANDIAKPAAPSEWPDYITVFYSPDTLKVCGYGNQSSTFATLMSTSVCFKFAVAYLKLAERHRNKSDWAKKAKELLVEAGNALDSSEEW